MYLLKMISNLDINFTKMKAFFYKFIFFNSVKYVCFKLSYDIDVITHILWIWIRMSKAPLFRALYQQDS